MPAQETTQAQPQAQQMQMPAPPETAHTTNEQPKPIEQMTPEPMSMRGGGSGGICCGLCAGLACFECLECCC